MARYSKMYFVCRLGLVVHIDETTDILWAGEDKCVDKCIVRLFRQLAMEGRTQSANGCRRGCGDRLVTENFEENARDS